MRRSILWCGVLAALAAGTALAAPRDEVVSAFQKAMDDGSYRMHMTAQTGNGPVDMTMDVQLPSSFRMKNPQGEFIVLPQGTWMNAGGQWMKFPMNMSQMIDGYTAEAMKEGMAAIQNVEYVGTETVQGCSARQYSYTASGKFMGVQSDSEAQIWICEDSGLPIQVVSSERGKSDKVRIVYDWDTPISIRPPN